MEGVEGGEGGKSFKRGEGEGGGEGGGVVLLLLVHAFVVRENVISNE